MHVSRLFVKPLSLCEHDGNHGLHNWMVYEHDANWQHVRAFCTRCGLRTATSSSTLGVVKHRIDEWWSRRSGEHSSL